MTYSFGAFSILLSRSADSFKILSLELLSLCFLLLFTTLHISFCLYAFFCIAYCFCTFIFVTYCPCMFFCVVYCCHPCVRVGFLWIGYLFFCIIFYCVLFLRVLFLRLSFLCVAFLSVANSSICFILLYFTFQCVGGVVSMFHGIAACVLLCYITFCHIASVTWMFCHIAGVVCILSPIAGVVCMFFCNAACSDLSCITSCCISWV